ncbi:MAG: DUF302 domain-containing protein [Planctomycetota bacterium]
MGKTGGDSMLMSVESEKPLARLKEDVAKACAAHKFGVLAVHDLREKMKEKGVQYEGECLIFEVCNPQKAKEALEAEPEISTALPCRISVYRGKDGKTRLSTIRPTALVALYEASGLKGLAEEVEATLSAILKEAAR